MKIENKFGNIKERILQIGDYYDVGRKNICEKIGMTYGNFTGKAKDTPINSIAIQNIISIYPQISIDWLLTGQGTMLRESNNIIPQQRPELSQQSEIIILLKEQLKEKDEKIERQAQEIGQLKQQISDLKDDGREHSSDAGGVAVAGVG